MLALCLLVLLGGTLAVSASTAHGVVPPAAAQPALSPLPLPIPPIETCQPGSAAPICQQQRPTTTAPPPLPPTALPSPPPCDPALPLAQCEPTGTATSSEPCIGEGCIPQPSTPAPPPTDPGTRQPGDTDDGAADCGITDVGGCVTNAINGFFRGIVEDALNPLLDLLSKTLLTTPTPESLPRIGQLWHSSWQILLASYGLLVLIAGVLVMGYETLQTRHSVKEIAPRLAVGFLAGAVSLWAATRAIELANALARAVLGDGLDATAVGTTLRNLVMGSLNGGIWIIFIGIVLAGMLVVLLVTYIVRVALTIILVAGAPLALMCHALPQTEGIARWWWKAFAGCLAIQIAQSLTLITAIRVFLAPGGFSLFGPTMSGLVNLLVALALMYILFKIPFWMLSSVKGGGGRSLLGSLARGYIAYKTFGLLGGRGSGAHLRASTAPSHRGGGTAGGGTVSGGSAGAAARARTGPADPFARPRTNASGQYLLPLTGGRRSRPPRTPRPAPAPTRRGGRARQLALPLGDDWPENKPVLGSDGQYRLPLPVERATPSRSPTPTTATSPSRPAGRRRGRQLELPFGPYKGNRPTPSGQYPLPLEVRRVPRAPPPPAPPRPPAPRTRTRQPELPFDPYRGNRPTRSGQYPLPLEGLRRTPAAKPMPPPSPAPARAPRRQPRLPLDLPAPARPATRRPHHPGGST